MMHIPISRTVYQSSLLVQINLLSQSINLKMNDKRTNPKSTFYIYIYIYHQQKDSINDAYSSTIAGQKKV